MEQLHRVVRNFECPFFEEKFEFPLWKLIKQRAKEKDISYLAALNEVSPEYGRCIRYGDKEFEEGLIENR